MKIRREKRCESQEELIAPKFLFIEHCTAVLGWSMQTLDTGVGRNRYISVEKQRTWQSTGTVGYKNTHVDSHIICGKVHLLITAGLQVFTVLGKIAGDNELV